MVTDWGKAAENAADKTDKELAAGIERLITSDIGKLFPVPADAAKIRLLCQHIRVKTAYNERVAAFKAVLATLGSDLQAVVKKAMFPLILIVMAFAGQVRAQEVTASGINIKDLLANTRVGVWLPIEGGRTFKTVYAPVVWLHGLDGTEYICLDAGAAAPGEITQGYGMLALGIRIDNLLDKALGISKWTKAHISAAQLPTIEAGVSPMLYQSKIRFGWNLAIKF